MGSVTRYTGHTLGWLFALVFLAAWQPGDLLQAVGDSPVVTAARTDNLSAVQALVAERADVNAPGRDGSTALLWAAYHADLEMVQALVAAGATVDAANAYGVTPLLQASRTGNAAVVRALLAAGADPLLAHPEGETPLMAASQAGSVEAVRLLLETGSNVNAVDAYQAQTALMWAAAEGHVEVLDTLLAAGADPNVRAHITALEERKHADHPTGGFTALMFAVRNGHETAVRSLIAGGADPDLTNGDGASAGVVAVVNDRLDLAATLVDLGANPNDGSLYFAVDMHDATTDMRARDGSRLRADHPNTLTSLDLIKKLLEAGADPNKPFVGQLHSYTLCCDGQVNASPFFRAAVASDVEVMNLMIAHGAHIEWSPAEVKKDEGGGGRGMNANVGRTPLMVTLNGGRGAAFAAGPGFERLGPPPFREPAEREPLVAVQLLLAAGADPNAKAPNGATLLHQAVQAQQVPIIRELVAAGASLDAVDKDNLTPLLLAEKPEPEGRGIPAANTDPDRYRRQQDSKEDVIAALRELMNLGPDDPAPVPPPLPVDESAKEEPAEVPAASPQGAQ